MKLSAGGCDAKRRMSINMSAVTAGPGDGGVEKGERDANSSPP